MRVFRELSALPDLSNCVLTIGSFDGVHSGHQKIIDRVKHISDEFECENVVITFHPHPRSIVYPKDKSLRLLSSLKEKIALFEKYGIDNVVIIPFTIEFSQISALEYIENLLVKNFKPNFIVIGYDHRFGLNRQGDIDMLKNLEEKYDYKIIEIPKQEIDEITISSTKIRNALLEGDLTSANTLLSHPYEISGIVIRGRKLGTEIGFPTANLKLENKQKLIPKDGIYACYTIVNNQRYKGMLYIGDIPTIGTDNPKSIEVNIFDFNDDIYGQRITIQLLHFLRGEEKFNGLEELKAALIIDRAESIKFFDQFLPIDIPRVTVAILNYNTRHYLETFLPSISFSSKESFKTLVINNGSEDDSVEFVQDWFPEILTVQLSENYGFAKAYNIGTQDVDSEYIAIVNSDVHVSENWLDPLVKFLDNNKSFAAVMPKILSFEDESSFEYAGGSGGFQDTLGYPYCRGRIFDTIELDTNQYDDIQSISWASGAAMVARRELFEQIGGFDADFFAHQEEIDLCWRLRKAGYKIAVVPEATIFHLGGGTLDYGNKKKIYLNFRNSLFSLFKNEYWYNLFWKLPFRLVLDGVAGLKFLLSGQLNSMFAIIRAHLSFYVKIPSLISKRIAVNRLVKNNSIGRGHSDGVKAFSIVFQYFILGRKHFTDIK